MAKLNDAALRLTLVLAGLFAVLSGIDTALGGLETLGWMGQAAFYEVSDQAGFLVADNHQRFLGGVWTGLGLAIFFALRDLERHRTALALVFGMVFLGGLSRFSQLNLAVTFGPDIAGALFVELVGMPALFIWLQRTVKRAA